MIDVLNLFYKKYVKSNSNEHIRKKKIKNKKKILTCAAGLKQCNPAMILIKEAIARFCFGTIDSGTTIFSFFF